MKRIGIGIAGWGFMGKTHTYALKTMPLFYENMNFSPELRMVCTRRLDKARQAMASQGFAAYTDDFNALLADTSVDVVSICTPNELHEQMAIAALEHGKHVYIDKPLSISAASAHRIADAARKSACRTALVLNNRFFPATMRMKQLIDAGRLGSITSFRAEYLHSGSVDPTRPMGWKMRGSDGGGVLLDMGSHALDLILWLCGDARSVQCRMQTLYSERPLPDGSLTSDVGDDQAILLLELQNGALGTVEASKIATGTDDQLNIDIYGTQGALRWHSMAPDYLGFYDCTRPGGELGGEQGFTSIQCGAKYAAPGGAFLPPKNSIGWVRAHVHCYYSFLDAVVNGTPFQPDIEWGAYLQTVMESAARSAREGSVITL